MLGSLKNSVKGAVSGVATKVAGKLSQTEWGKEALRKEIEKMPMPPQAKQMFLKILDNKPELLMKIAEETQELVKAGKNQMSASQSVMMKYQKELREAMMGR